MRCEVLHGSFRQKVNRRSTAFSTYPSVADVDQYLKRSIEIYQTSMSRVPELTEYIRNSLRPVEVKDHELKIECVDGGYLVEIPNDFYSALSFEVHATKEGCEECGKILLARKVKSKMIAETLKDPYRKPSYEYEEVVYDEFGDKWKFYTNNEFNLTKIFLSYYRKVKPCECPSLATDQFYIDYLGNRVDKDVDFEINSTYVYDDITDIAAFLFLKDVGDAVDADAQLKSIGLKYKLIN